MGGIVLYISMGLDAYLEDPTGGVDWPYEGRSVWGVAHRVENAMVECICRRRRAV